MEPDIFIITKLLSDPSRMHILDILMDGKAHTVNEIASFTKIKQHTVSYHLKLLTEAQVTTLQTYGRFHYYSLNPNHSYLSQLDVTYKTPDLMSHFLPPHEVSFTFCCSSIVFPR
ncbi:ArsR family transcriptional regulator [Streptococcus pneumoniae]|nr:ArsR family transcriptional regulator [Streptococcus pneumoniae]